MENTKYLTENNYLFLDGLIFKYEKEFYSIEVRSGIFTIGDLTFNGAFEKLNKYCSKYNSNKRITRFSLESFLSLFENFGTMVHCSDGFYGIKVKNLPFGFELCISQKLAADFDKPTVWNFGGIERENDFNAPVQNGLERRVRGKEIADFKVLFFLKDLILQEAIYRNHEKKDVQSWKKNRWAKKHMGVFHILRIVKRIKQIMSQTRVNKIF